MPRLISETVKDNEMMGFISARLKFSGFAQTDAGDFTCYVQDGYTDVVHTETIKVEYDLPRKGCSVNSPKVYFAILLLNTDCKMWEEIESQEISSIFLQEILEIINDRCQNCSAISSEHVTIMTGPECSNHAPKATVFKGTIETEANIFTTDIFCALTSWHGEDMPHIVLNDTMYFIDRDCVLRLISPNDTECVAKIGTDFGTAIIGAIGVASVIAALILADAFFLIVYLYTKSRKKYVWHDVQ